MLDSMPRIYKGVLRNNHIEWQGEAPPPGRSVRIQATVSDEIESDDSTRGARMAAALEKLAENDTFSEINEPVEWQRRIRQDRPLPGQENNPA